MNDEVWSRDMNIGLFGFSFEDRNKGCEALTYSFVSILNDLVPNNLTIINLSGIGEAKELQKIFPKIKFEVTGFQRKKIGLNSFHELLKCDVVFDCTFGDNFSDIYSKSFASKTTLLKELTLLLHKPLVLAPQTIGPFSDKQLIGRVKKVLKKCSRIYTRDILSTEYVKELSGVNAITVTDLAFLLPYDNQSNLRNGKRVGINVSGLLWNGGFENNNQFELSVDYQEYTRSIIQWLLNNSYDVYLIPHVNDENTDEIDEDYKICTQLAKEYDLPAPILYTTPIEVKSFISGMDFFIGSRMHSTVAAFSSGVVTIPFSYSRKFEGLYHNLNYDYIIDGKTLSTEKAILETKGMIVKYKDMRSSQEKSMEKIKSLEDTFISSLIIYLESI